MYNTCILIDNICSGEFPFNDPSTNIGHVISPMMESLYPEGTSIKLVVHPQLMDSDENTPSISFTCDGKFTHIEFIMKNL